MILLAYTTCRICIRKVEIRSEFIEVKSYFIIVKGSWSLSDSSETVWPLKYWKLYESLRTWVRWVWYWTFTWKRNGSLGLMEFFHPSTYIGIRYHPHKENSSIWAASISSLVSFACNIAVNIDTHLGGTWEWSKLQELCIHSSSTSALQIQLGNCSCSITAIMLSNFANVEIKTKTSLQFAKAIIQDSRSLHRT